MGHPAISFSGRWGSVANEYPFLYTNKGVTLLSEHFLQDLGINSLFVAERADFSSEFTFSDLADNEGVVLTKYGVGTAGQLGWFRAAFSTQVDSPRHPGNYRGLWTQRFPVVACLAKIDVALRDLVKKRGAVKKALLDSISILDDEVDEPLHRAGEKIKKSEKKRFETVYKSAVVQGKKFAYWRLTKPYHFRHQSAFIQTWLEVFGQQIIPFGEESRRRNLAAAYQKLKSNVEKYEAIEQQKDFRI
jgi:hypothetical protein